MIAARAPEWQPDLAARPPKWQPDLAVRLALRLCGSRAQARDDSAPTAGEAASALLFRPEDTLRSRPALRPVRRVGRTGQAGTLPPSARPAP
ncbi:hypothetical protein AB0C18_23005 [Nonomuraea muscovyensis]|uniref:hypothetical protein n=1 Tax=Nonomuraea muscovyensis TaxID=1124761 RepID=UPI0033ED8D7E